MKQSFADALNELMAGSAMSANKVAARVEVDPAQVGRWRKGLGLPRPENIVRIASVFGVDYEWLMGLAYPESRPRAIGPLSPRLAAFLSVVEAGFRALEATDQAALEVAERGARALFSVPSVGAKAAGGLGVNPRHSHRSGQHD